MKIRITMAMAMSLSTLTSNKVILPFWWILKLRGSRRWERLSRQTSLLKTSRLARAIVSSLSASNSLEHEHESIGTSNSFGREHDGRLTCQFISKSTSEQTCWHEERWSFETISVINGDFQEGQRTRRTTSKATPKSTHVGRFRIVILNVYFKLSF